MLAYISINSFPDIQIETRNNKLEMQSVNNKALIEELDKLLERLHVPSEVSNFLILYCNPMMISLYSGVIYWLLLLSLFFS